MPLISMFQSPYPNPFSNQITMGFNLKRDMSFKINIFDLLGRRVNMIEKKEGFFWKNIHLLGWKRFKW
jgi:hypothetical protein